MFKSKNITKSIICISLKLLLSNLYFSNFLTFRMKKFIEYIEMDLLLSFL